MKNLKTILFGAILLPSLAFAQETKEFQLEGKAPAGLKKVFLTYYDYNTNDPVVDSVKVVGGKFSFKGEIEGASYAGLYFREDLNDFSRREPVKEFWFHLNEGKTIIDASQGSKAKLVGGSKFAEQYIASENELVQERELFKNTNYYENVSKIDSLQKDIQKINAQQEKIESTWNNTVAKNRLEFIKKHPENTMSLVYLENLANTNNPEYDIKGMFANLSEEIRTSKRAERLLNTLRARALVVGADAYDFEQNDVNGKPVKLSDFKGKYVLIDFWASWCKPCRQENPNVVKAYQAYKDKNFEILGVSLDSDKNNWLKAIKDDGLTWTNVSDLKGWKNEVGELYAIKAVPTNYLISPEGKIIAKDLRGADLEKFLAEKL
ncbi:redoxin domain-containing protein [Sphingobacterium daejeonense]|uniref:Redoxin domain-containing protein n=1 Tax=Sphingobacterium daejeonense TaxID=371142 RepID=A0ABW3RHB4_9SPHI